jgi:glycosyltransferase involved in cell wall biosynthesis
MSAETIRLLAVLEARTITGPAKNLLEFCRVARALEGPRVETVIATWRRPDQRGGDEFLEAAGAAGIDVEVVEERSAFDRNGAAALRRIVERRDPDVVQTHAVKSHFLLRASGLGRRKPWVAFHHGYTFQDMKMRAYNLLDCWSLRAPARIVTMSRAFAGQLAARGVRPERITVVHNAIEPDWLARAGISREQARREVGVASGQPLIVALGRLSCEKGFDCLLEAFGRFVHAKVLGTPVLMIVGDGPERGNLERQAAALGVSGYVRITGQRKEVRPFYAAADVVAISSVTEGSPNVLLEAMAARVPVVATAVGGIPEIVAHEESSLLVAARDAPALGGAMARVLKDREEAEARVRRAYDLILSRHSPQARARYLVELYREVLAANLSLPPD